MTTSSKAKLNTSKSAHKKIILIVIVITGLIAILLATFLIINRTSPVAAKFNEPITLRVNQAAILNDDGKEVTFRITEFKPASTLQKMCSELCTDNLDVFYTKLTYNNTSYKGVSYGGLGSAVDMSFKENGDYENIPYEIRINSIATPSEYTVLISKK